MSNDSSFLKTTLDLLETDPEVKSFIYQQIIDFNPFVTPDTLVMVIARDPAASYTHSVDEEDEFFDDEELAEELKKFKYRIAVILKEGENSIEAEAYHDDIFEAIRLAKERLIERLLEIQEEVESPQDRINAIKDASENKQIH
jgi:ribosome-associated translation inhibitor RaiA